MITNGAYVLYKTFNSSEAVNEWINEGTPLISNRANFIDEIKLLNDWKDEHRRDYKPRKDGKRAYVNIYAHQLTFLIPHEVEKEQWDTFVKKYAEAISPKYRSGKKKPALLWVAKYFTINEANYAELVCFSRKVYEQTRMKFKKYNQDYWFDSKGNRCKKTTKGAVLKCKKGDYVLDEHGNKVKVVSKVKNVEEDKNTFRYSNFEKFTYRLKKKWLKVAQKMSDRKQFLLISKTTIKENESQTMRKSYLKLNKNIDEINTILKNYQTGMKDGGFDTDDIYKSLYKMMNEVDYMIHKKYVEFSKVKEFIQGWWIKEVAGDWIEA